MVWSNSCSVCAPLRNSRSSIRRMSIERNFSLNASGSELRSASTVAPQSLALMNGEFTLAQAKFFAERVAKEAGDSTDESKVARAWQLAFSRRPSNTELTDALGFLAKQRAHFTTNAPKTAPVAKGKEPPPANADDHALTSLCQALLTANRFLYVE